MKRSELEIYLEQQLIELRGYQKDNAEIVDILIYALEDIDILPVYDSGMSGEWEPEDG